MESLKSKQGNMLLFADTGIMQLVIIITVVINQTTILAVSTANAWKFIDLSMSAIPHVLPVAVHFNSDDAIFKQCLAT